MGQFVSLFCILVCPNRVLKEESVIYKGPNSSIYEIKNQKMVCKVVYNYNMFTREQNFIKHIKKLQREENIIRYYNIVPYHTIFLMQRADLDLLEWAKNNYQKKFYIRDLKILMGQLAHGYRFLLKNHIEHYDIKPDNLLLVGGVLKIADFGTCHIGQDNYFLNTGTMGFIAPEIAGCTNKNFYVPHSMDVYSICLMLSYLEFAPIFKKFYYRKWTLRNYLSLEEYMHRKYPFTFLTWGTIVDQCYRMPIADLLEHIENDASDAKKDLLCL